MIHPNAVIRPKAQIGADCEIGPAAHVGTDAQHLNYDRSLETWLVVGDYQEKRTRMAGERLLEAVILGQQSK